MYRKTYFDIDSGYRWGTGYPNDEARQTFKEESRAIARNGEIGGHRA